MCHYRSGRRRLGVVIHIECNQSRIWSVYDKKKAKRLGHELETLGFVFLLVVRRRCVAAGGENAHFVFFFVWSNGRVGVFSFALPRIKRH